MLRPNEAKVGTRKMNRRSTRINADKRRIAGAFEESWYDRTKPKSESEKWVLSHTVEIRDWVG